ncbi:hypothetical protein PCANC_27469 [Puccinia coronata f. sp. avenae]|uniref:Uncharacterized protein n=1 Tax=Puccinia coronata f. sp. avenae TaxID=200324 RepID=A0A2N5S0N4_9BASI|nr:hypothetical protein PCANC_27469 [Puccinia coronata f. sp. avenae]
MDEPTQDNKPPTESNLAHVDQRQILYLDSQHSKYLPPSQYMKDVSGFMAQNLASRPQKDGKADKPPTHEYLVHNLPHLPHSTGAIESKGNPPFPKRRRCLINKVPAGSIAAQEKKNCFVGHFNGAAANDQSVVEHPIPQVHNPFLLDSTLKQPQGEHDILVEKFWTIQTAILSNKGANLNELLKEQQLTKGGLDLPKQP